MNSGDSVPVSGNSGDSVISGFTLLVTHGLIYGCNGWVTALMSAGSNRATAVYFSSGELKERETGR